MASARSPAGRRAMLAHREAREIAVGTDGKMRVLADLLAEHFPERILIFTTDNATVYRISQGFLIPAITHQTPVKERHEILTRFREGEYKTLVASHVLNEGVDVPAASIAIILSGTGSPREYIQRLGRILRKSQDKNKRAILYEVVTEDTSEEGTSQRRRGVEKNEPQRRRGHKDEENQKYRQLELMPSEPIYGVGQKTSYKAAESKSSGKYNVSDNLGENSIEAEPPLNPTKLEDNSIQNPKSKIQNRRDVTKRVTDSSAKRRVDNPEAPED
jgi:superfamily II DNA or RNA helicase